MEVQVLAFNRFLNNRLLGSASLSLQRLLDESQIQLAASLIDINGRPLKVSKIETKIRGKLGQKVQRIHIHGNGISNKLGNCLFWSALQAFIIDLAGYQFPRSNLPLMYSRQVSGESSIWIVLERHDIILELSHLGLCEQVLNQN